MKLWGGRFTKPTNELVDEYTASIHFDKRLAKQDVIGSMAHVEMLKQCDILSETEAGNIQDGLRAIAEKIAAGKVKMHVENEDIHMNIEKLLIDEIGPVGGKLHTGRSRNDQVALDMRLYLREELLELISLAASLQEALANTAEEQADTLMPGYTHLQRAQPVSFAHHLLAYIFMLQRDIERLQESWKRVNKSPLGAGALAGTTFPIDRYIVSDLLGMDGICDNSLDAVSDRDFVVEFLANASLLIAHLSRLCEELVIWSSAEFKFIELDDAFCTGSSMMPQKKNPDVAELVRGKSGRVYGNLMGMLTTLKGLPLAYNKDMQEDKEGMFDTVDTLKGALQLFSPMIESMRVNKEKMQQAVSDDFSNATDLADYLVSKGLPFREAHAVVGQIVLYCIQQGDKFILDLSLAEMKSFSDLIDEDIYQALTGMAVVNARDVAGGTAINRVHEQLQTVECLLQETDEWTAQKYEKLTSVKEGAHLS
ncbi:argininosuccinate lyase [Virgibacillus halophilus]|uniref:Argininosuccinate lyase n=1 Tax=Tigheibacillus halophilus TaxID=361280 RepID=A0ABU5C570_9BACI|nr:argininosuccinate lyase [Virgibacillus halophilus]